MWRRLTITNGTSQGLFIVVAIVIFGIFVAMSQILFGSTLTNGITNIFEQALDMSESELTEDGRVIVNFEDDNLKSAVIEELETKYGIVVENGEVTEDDMKQVVTLDLRGKNVGRLHGLEHARNMVTLNLSNNNLTAINVLTNLINLRNLDLDGNEIEDISPLANITSLERVKLSNNKIKDIPNLDNLTNLIDLDVTGNELSKDSDTYLDSLDGVEVSKDEWVAPPLEPAPASDFTYIIENNRITITGYIGSETEIRIPETIFENYPRQVARIGAGAFRDSNLTRVDLPDNLTSIGPDAFRGGSLEHIVIPDSVVTIENYAFWENYATKITLGESVETIGHWAFARNRFSDVYFPDSVSVIGNEAFYYNTNLESVELPTGVDYQPSNAQFPSFLSQVTITFR